MKINGREESSNGEKREKCVLILNVKSKSNIKITYNLNEGEEINWGLGMYEGYND